MIIPILGCPGSGKTTVINQLKQEYGCPGFEMSWMPEFHSMNGEPLPYEGDEQIAVGALVRIAAEYVRAGHRYVFLSDFRNEVVPQLIKHLATEEVRFVILSFSDESTISERVLDPDRPSGYRNVDAAVEANRWLADQAFPNALRIDVSTNPADAVVETIACTYRLPNKPLERTR